MSFFNLVRSDWTVGVESVHGVMSKQEVSSVKVDFGFLK